MIPKQDIIAFAKKEFSTTKKMLAAYPGEKNNFKPHERSSDVLKLTSTFVFEMYLLTGYLFGGTFDRSIFQTYKPADIKNVISDFEKETNEIVQKLELLSEEDYKKTIQFGGQTYTGDTFILMMICDQIHHRGQLSVYVRMAGGKVPSIYGPSADDTSTNL